MRLKGLRVKGKLGFHVNFGDYSIVLGQNNTGKSTFYKLIIYCLGANIYDFIQEISEHRMCQQVELDLECKNGNRYRILRKLPYSESVITFSLDDNWLPLEDSMDVLSLDEFSDFLLREENYPAQKISYGKDKTATLRYYFLLRACVVDQDTPAYKIFTDIGGRDKDYINSQELIKKAIIEAIIGRENHYIQMLRFELQSSQSEKREITSKLKFVGEMILQKASAEEVLKSITIDEIQKELKRITKEKDLLIAAKLEHLASLERLKARGDNKKIIGLRRKKGELENDLRLLTLREIDLNRIIDGLSGEIVNIKKMVLAKDILTNIPVEKCPVCLAPLVVNRSDDGTCPMCGALPAKDDLDNVVTFKRVLDESLIEANGAKGDIVKNIASLNSQIRRAEEAITSEMERYFSAMAEERQPVENLLRVAISSIDELVLLEEKLKSHLELLEMGKDLRAKKAGIELIIKDLRERLDEAERSLSSKDTDKIKQWRDVFTDLVNYIYGDVRQVELDDNHMPVVDGFDARNISSASLKVVLRLGYILSLARLNSDVNINHTGYTLYDSPRDKDLDIDKYIRFIDALSDANGYQIIITANINEKELFRKGDILLELSQGNKLLRPITS